MTSSGHVTKATDRHTNAIFRASLSCLLAISPSTNSKTDFWAQSAQFFAGQMNCTVSMQLTVRSHYTVIQRTLVQSQNRTRNDEANCSTTLPWRHNTILYWHHKLLQLPYIKKTQLYYNRVRGLFNIQHILLQFFVVAEDSFQSVIWLMLTNFLTMLLNQAHYLKLQWLLKYDNSVFSQ